MTIAVAEGFPPEDVWRRLAAESRNIFVTPEWVRTWWDYFGRDEPITLEQRDENGERVAVLPAYVTTKAPLRLLRLAGHGPADELGPACAPSRRLSFASDLGQALRRFALCDLFIGEQLPGDIQWARASGGVNVGYIASPALPLEWEDWDSYLQSKSGHFRGQVRRLERQLVKAGAAFRLIKQKDELEPALDILFRLHENHFRGSLFATSEQRFHREFANRAFDNGWLRLWIVEVGDEPVAAWYGFRFVDHDAHYQSGRLPTFELAQRGLRGVGFALDAWTIRTAIEDGRAQYRFLRGGEEYKYRWATEDYGLATMMVPTNKRGAIPSWLMTRDAHGTTPVAVQKSAGRVMRRYFLT